jgi:predicted PurR-regulated permease PerM
LNAPAARRVRVAPILTAVVLTVLLLWLVGATADVLLLLFIAILLSLYLGALAAAVTRRFGIPRKLALALAIVLSVTAVGGLVALLVPPVVSQTQQLFGVLPKFMASWERAIDDFVRTRVPALASVWKPGEHTLLVAIYEQAGSMFGNVVPKVFSIVHAVINVFSVAVMAIYLSLYPGIYREWLIALFPPLHRDLVRDVLSDLAETLRSWIVGQLLAMFVLAMLTALGLWILDVPYWLTFGVFTGAVAIVPFFGTLVSTTLPALFVLSGPGGGTKALLVILLGTVIHVLEGNLVVPLITAKKVDLPPVLTILAVLIVGKLLGPAGLLVAVPMLAVIMVLVRRILINRIYEGQGFRRTARDHALVLRVPVPEGGVVLPGLSSIDVIALSERAPLPRSA